jgi:hypothetical protein
LVNKLEAVTKERDEAMRIADAEHLCVIEAEDEKNAATARAEAAERREGRLREGIRDFINDYMAHDYHAIGPAEVARRLSGLLAQPEREVGDDGT